MGNNIMGIHPEQPAGTRRRHAENRKNYQPRPTGLIHALGVIFLLCSLTTAIADSARIATYNVSLGRRGPGVLLKDILSGDDAQILALIEIIQHMRPDILLLNEFDHDHTLLALTAFRDVLAQGDGGISYANMFAPAGNAGQPSFLDLDDNGKSGEWADAHGFGRFPGSEGMALLSRWPIDTTTARNFANLAWEGPEFLPPEVRAALRLSSKSHWDVPVHLPDGRELHILASHPTPPVFDDARDLNGLRNAAEIQFWVSYLDGAGSRAGFTGDMFVILGDLNNDPLDGEGHKAPLQDLLNHPRVADPMQTSDGAVISAQMAAGANLTQAGDAAQDTVDWGAEIGNMRVDYALPSANLTVTNSGVFWPAPDAPLAEAIGEGHDGASNHRMVWVDITLNP